MLMVMVSPELPPFRKANCTVFFLLIGPSPGQSSRGPFALQKMVDETLLEQALAPRDEALLVLFLAAMPGAWQRTGEVDGVTLYTRETLGGPFHSMKGSGIVDAPARIVAQVLLDDPRASEWVDSLAEAKVVRMLAADEYIEYNHVSMPPLIHDREFITDVRMGVDADSQLVVIESKPADEG